MKPTPQFLCIEIAGEHANQVGLMHDLAALASRSGGNVLAQAPAGRVGCLEPGTVGASLLIAKWPDGALLRDAAQRSLLPALRAALPSGAAPLVLAADALPDEGLPQMMDVPTTASVPRPPAVPRNTFLLIRGSAWNQAKLDQYRDVILPMHKERGGYYESFAIMPGQVEALAGEWRDGIFAISRWPRRDVAEDFWFSERYQTAAIPLRLGGGRFAVHLLEAE